MSEIETTQPGVRMEIFLQKKSENNFKFPAIRNPSVIILLLELKKIWVCLSVTSEKPYSSGLFADFTGSRKECLESPINV